MIDVRGYETLELIRRNNNSVIYSARSNETGELVVLKKSIKNDSNEQRRILRREHEILMCFESEYVEKAIDYLEGDNVLVTAFAEGASLNSLIKSGGLSHDDKYAIVDQLIKALMEVQGAGIIHKDINPSNIIWEVTKKKLTLLDFNISEKSGATKVGFKDHKGLKGTIAYMSPEQTGRINRFLDYRSDFYSLGITLYELFTGELPFKQTSFLELIHSHIAVKPVEPCIVNTKVSKDMSRIIMKLISKNVEDRYQSLNGLLFDVSESQKGNKLEVLGANEFNEIFQLSQKLYGREGEIESLVNRFRGVLKGGSDYVLVAGYSGVGKTSVIKELYPQVTEVGGYFLTGKYDQFSLDIPYSGIQGIIEDYIDLLYLSGEEKIQEWRSVLLEKIGDLGQILIDFVPEIENIIGQQPQVPSLSGMEALNRFDLVIKHFILSMNESECPLVIFLDDMQWIDSASLHFLSELIDNEELQKTLIIGAFRHNEIHSSHLLQVFMNDLNHKNKDLKLIELAGISKRDVYNLMIDSSFDTCDLDDIVKSLHVRTEGNPFYLQQIMEYLNKKSCIIHCKESGKWTIESECLSEVKLSDNVADFIKNQLVALDKNKMTILKYASCLGSQFSLDPLVELMSIEEGQIQKLLEILSDYHFVQPLGVKEYMFAHDQIQQAAYMMMDGKELEINHGHLANFLIETHSLTCDNAKLYEITRHVKFGLYSGVVNLDKEGLINLLIKSAQIGMTNLAYVESRETLTILLKYIGVSGWEDHYCAMLRIYNSLVEIAYMTTAFEHVDALVALMKGKVKKSYHLATAYQYEVQSLMGRMAYGGSLKASIEGLNSIGLPISVDIDSKRANESFAMLAIALNGREVKELIHLPVMTDDYELEAMRMITAVMPLFFNMAPQLLPVVTIDMILRSIKHGNCKYSAFAYAFMGTLLCGAIRDYKVGLEYGELSIAVIDKLHAISEIPKTYMLTSQHIFQFRDHLDKVIDMEETAYYKGIETGDLTYAGFAGHGYCYNTYLAGYNLKNTLKIFKDYSTSFLRIKQGTQNTFQSIYMQSIANLIGGESPLVLSGEWFDENKALQTMIDQGHMTGLHVYYFNKTELAILFSDYEKALEYVNEFEKYLDGGVGLMQSTMYYQYASLALIHNMDKMEASKKEEALTSIVANQSILKALETSVNYGHRYLIVEAELAKYKGDFCRARDFYEEAIDLVKKHKYQKEEALYRELTGDFYESMGKKELAHYYIKSSRQTYMNWGALSKADQMVEKLSFYEKNMSDDTLYTTETYDTEYATNIQLEIGSILKFSREITQEIKYEELLKKLLYILLENAGATKAVIVNFTKDNRIMVGKRDVKDQFTLYEVEGMDQIDDAPIEMMKYALNGKKIIRLDNVSQSHMFKDSAYFLDKDIKSVLCYPIINKGNVIGIIYLENDLTYGSFLQERTRILTLLSSQIAISLENAMIYKHLENLVDERTNALKQKNSELETLNETLKQISVTDMLTSLFNRRHLDKVIEQEYHRVDRYERELSLILLDIDYFKSVNDTYGHHVGDQVLIEIANTLKNAVRKTDVVGRWGGEEFLVICPETNEGQAFIVAEKIRSCIESVTFDVVGHKTVSIGVTSLEQEDTVQTLLTRVDEYLYEAKARGRNKVVSKDNR